MSSVAVKREASFITDAVAAVDPVISCNWNNTDNHILGYPQFQDLISSLDKELG